MKRWKASLRYLHPYMFHSNWTCGKVLDNSCKYLAACTRISTNKHPEKVREAKQERKNLRTELNDLASDPW